MYRLNDTIVAVSSPTSGARVIVRISGPDTIDVLQQIFSEEKSEDRSQKSSVLSERSPWDCPLSSVRRLTQIRGNVAIDPELRIGAKLYLFGAPHSYTGEDVAEIHIHTNSSVTEVLMGSLLSRGLRMAGPGEFTARAYLNGKLDLAQAEAVNEIIVGSNKFQLAAAERLLAGRLGETTAKVRADIMDCLSLIEAGLDFSGEDIEEKSEDRNQKSSVLCPLSSVRRLTQLRDELDRLLSGSISYEEVVDLPAVGIAGAPNAGKSSLLNKLLGRARSIVSEHSKTTRDVLTGVLTLAHCRCVLFDCAGLTPSLVARGSSLGAPVTSHESRNILDELAQQAATEAIRNSSVVVFCIDVSKGTQTDYSEDIAIRQMIGYSGQGTGDREGKLNAKPYTLNPNWIAVATKCDLLSKEDLAKHLARLNDIFNADFLATSAKAGTGAELLKEAIDRKLIELAVAGAERNSRCEIRDTRYEIALPEGMLCITARHRQAVIEAIENVGESISELQAGSDEVAAMMLRAAYQSICDIEQQHVDEQILERIFSRFCIGK